MKYKLLTLFLLLTINCLGQSLEETKEWIEGKLNDRKCFRGIVLNTRQTSTLVSNERRVKNQTSISEEFRPHYFQDETFFRLQDNVLYFKTLLRFTMSADKHYWDVAEVSIDLSNFKGVELSSIRPERWDSDYETIVFTSNRNNIRIKHTPNKGLPLVHQLNYYTEILGDEFRQKIEFGFNEGHSPDIFERFQKAIKHYISLMKVTTKQETF